MDSRPDLPIEFACRRAPPPFDYENEFLPSAFAQSDPEVFAHERLTIATMYESQPWDAKWLETYYHLDMQSPPENWLSLNEESEKQAILNALSSDMNGAVQ